VLQAASVASVVTGTSLPITVRASQLVSHFSVHAGKRMRQGERSYVLYSQTVQRNAGRKTEISKEEEEARGLGVTVWRGKVLLRW